MGGRGGAGSTGRGVEACGRRSWRAKERRGGSGAGGGARAEVAAGVEGDGAGGGPGGSHGGGRKGYPRTLWKQRKKAKFNIYIYMEAKL